MLYNTYMKYLTIVLAYLLGSIPWSLIIGRLFFKTDIREHGSGNLGGTNAGRILGKKAGVVVMALDILKCILAVYIGSLFSQEIGVMCGVACTLGHCYPIFANFKGGKAVSTSIGCLFSICAFLSFNWLLIIIPVVVFLLVLYIFKMVSLASITAFITISIVACFLPMDWLPRLSIIFLSLLIIWRHRENIKRLLNKEERKITWM